MLIVFFLAFAVKVLFTDILGIDLRPYIKRLVERWLDKRFKVRGRRDNVPTDTKREKRVR